MPVDPKLERIANASRAAVDHYKHLTATHPEIDALELAVDAFGMQTLTSASGDADPAALLAAARFTAAAYTALTPRSAEIVELEASLSAWDAAQAPPPVPSAPGSPPAPVPVPAGTAPAPAPDPAAASTEGAPPADWPDVITAARELVTDFGRDASTIYARVSRLKYALELHDAAQVQAQGQAGNPA